MKRAGAWGTRSVLLGLASSGRTPASQDCSGQHIGLRKPPAGPRCRAGGSRRVSALRLGVSLGKRQRTSRGLLRLSCPCWVLFFHCKPSWPRLLWFPAPHNPVPSCVTDLDCSPVPGVSLHFSRGQEQSKPCRAATRFARPCEAARSCPPGQSSPKAVPEGRAGQRPCSLRQRAVASGPQERRPS